MNDINTKIFDNRMPLYNKDITKIIDFINSEFINSEALEDNFKNFKKLQKYFLEKNINSLHHYDVSKLLKCELLAKTIKIISSNKELNDILYENVKFYKILYSNLYRNHNKNSNSSKKYINKLNKESYLSKEDELDLIKRAKEGDINARKEVILSNLKYITSIAMSFKVVNISPEDLINEGVIALDKSIDDFDISLNCKLISYAKWKIIHNIVIYIKNNSKAITIPYNIVKETINLTNIEKEFYEKNNRYPTNKELSKILNLSLKQVEELKKKELLWNNLSLDCLNEEDYIYDSLEDDILSKIVDNQTIKIYENVNLTELQREIITLMIQKKTLSEIGKIHGFSREYIRQEKNKSLEKILKCLRQYDIGGNDDGK